MIFYRIVSFIFLIIFINQNALFGQNETFDSLVKKHQSNFFPIPKIIWQTYKTKNLSEDCIRCQNSWIKWNPSYTVHLFDDQDIKQYILKNWDERMLKFFESLPIGVMKADLWRYLILATEGGIYSDLDSVSLRPIELWPLKEDSLNNQQENFLLIGLENDSHFCQWTIAASKNHPAMYYICEYILKNFETFGIDLKNKYFVHGTTGPGIWTGAIVSLLNEPAGTSSGAIFSKYQKDPCYKAFVNSKGIYLYNESFFKSICSRNLYGSQHFKDGYISWTDEANSITKNK